MTVFPGMSQEAAALAMAGAATSLVLAGALLGSLARTAGIGWPAEAVLKTGPLRRLPR
jgi:hypothetical protein